MSVKRIMCFGDSLTCFGDSLTWGWVPRRDHFVVPSGFALHFG
jgi:hypothetical protein